MILRPALPEDLPVLLEMRAAVREATPRPHRGGKLSDEAASQMAARRYLDAMDSDHHRLLLATMPDGEVGGMTLLVRTDFSQVLDAPVIHVAETCVRSAHRSRGVGRALVGAATLWAEESDSANVVVSVQPGSRESHRYYARLGFSPMIMLRSAPVTAIRRALGETARPALARSRSKVVPARALRIRRAEIVETISPQA